MVKNNQWHSGIKHLSIFDTIINILMRIVIFIQDVNGVLEHILKEKLFFIIKIKPKLTKSDFPGLPICLATVRMRIVF